MESLRDTIASFNSSNCSDAFLIPVIVMVISAIIILLAVGCILTFMHENIRQHERGEAVFSVQLQKLQHSEISLNLSRNCGTLADKTAWVGIGMQGWYLEALCPLRVLVETAVVLLKGLCSPPAAWVTSCLRHT